MFIDWAHFNGSDFTGAGKSFLKARVFLKTPYSTLFIMMAMMMGLYHLVKCHQNKYEQPMF